MSFDLHFTDADWQRIGCSWAAWWAGRLARPMVMIESCDPSMALAALPETPPLTCNFPLDMPADDVLEQYEPYLETRRYYGDAWPRWKPSFGGSAGFLGAKVILAPDTVWFEPSRLLPIQEMQLAFDPENVWWRRVKEMTQAAVTRWGNRVSVGLADLPGNLDVLAALRGTQQVLMELYDAPQDVSRLLGEVTSLWQRYYGELYRIIRAQGRGTTPFLRLWSPGRCYSLQSDFSYMISPAMFERFVVPDLRACCDYLDHAFYHLDGKAQLSHLDQLLSLQKLHGIQWDPGDMEPPPDEWLPLLKQIREAGKLCMLYVTAEGARTIVRALGGRGFAFAIVKARRTTTVYDQLQMSEDEADELLHTLAAEDADGPWPGGAP